MLVLIYIQRAVYGRAEIPLFALSSMDITEATMPNALLRRNARILLVMCPHSNYLDNSFLFMDLINDSMLNVDPS